MWQDIVSSTRSNFGALVAQARKQLGLSDPMMEPAGAIVLAPSVELAPISTVSPMKRCESAGEDQAVVLSGGFMTSNQGSAAENPSSSSDTIETNAEPETVAVKAVPPQQKDKVGEDEEVEHSPLKEMPSSNS